MMLAIVVDRRPRTCPSASITNQRGSMSPFFGKYVRMTLLTTSDLIASSSGRGTTRKLKEGTPSLAERGKTVTLPNRRCQAVHSQHLPREVLTAAGRESTRHPLPEFRLDST